MDLLDFTPKFDEITITLKHPKTNDVLKNNDESDMSITMYASHTESFKDVQYDMIDRSIKESYGKKDYFPSAKDLESRSIERLVKTTKSWNITFGDEQPKFSKKKAEEVYKAIPWIREQLEEGIREQEDFI